MSIIAVLVLFVVLPFVANATQMPVIERLGIEQGLSQSIVYGVLQDHQGFLWICTRDGLNRYDGYDFTVYRHNPFDTSSLPWTAVNAIAEDMEGNLWLAVGRGLCKFERRTARFIRYPLEKVVGHTSIIGAVPVMRGDGRGNIWVGGERGLIRIDTRTGAAARYLADKHSAQMLCNDTIISLLVDRSGTLWVGSYGPYLHRFDADRGTFTRIDLGVENPAHIHVVGEDRRKKIWCGIYTHAGGYVLALVDPATGAIVRKIVDPGKRFYAFGSRIAAVCLDSLDGLWMKITSGGRTRGAEHASLVRVPLDDAGEEMVVVGPSPRTLGRVISSITCDRTGIVWVGTDEGVTKLILERPRFRTYRSDESDPMSLGNNHIRGIHKDRRGNLWVGSDNGLNRFDRRTGSWSRYLYDWKNPHSISANTANVIFEDTDGTLLVGTNLGVNIYNSGTNTFSRAYDIRPYLMQVWSFCRDSAGMLWIGTLGEGIFVFDRGGALVRHFGPEDNGLGGLQNEVVWDIHLDRYGMLWIGTSAGLYQWLPDQGRFRKLGVYPDDPRGLSDKNVCAIMEDRSGGLWFTTYGGGLNRYDRVTGAFTPITTRDGLPSNVLYGTLMDNRGRLWISSGAGIAVYDPATGACRTYTAGDGLQSNEFSFKAFHQTDDGEMFFGGARGLTAFHPESLAIDRGPVPMAITEFRVFDGVRRRELAEIDTIVIDHDQSYISFGFTAIEYANPANIRYAYRLVGLDDAWIDCGNRRYASFTNLDPGTYTFMVKATNSDGVWNSEPRSVVLRVVPPFWMTWWFRITAAVMVIGAVVGLFYMRMRAIRTRELLRRRSLESQLQALRLQINPHFIFNALSSIQHLILVREQERAVDYLARFSRLMRAVLENSERTSIPLVEEIESLRHYLNLESLRFEGCFGYRIDVDPDLDVAHMRIPTMLIQPCVENAIRHGLLHKEGEGNVTIHIASRGSAILCRVEDDGVGRKRAEELNRASRPPQRSMGMRVTQERLSILNAASMRSDPISMEITDLSDDVGSPCGTRVDIVIPFEYQ